MFTFFWYSLDINKEQSTTNQKHAGGTVCSILPLFLGTAPAVHVAQYTSDFVSFLEQCLSSAWVKLETGPGKAGQRKPERDGWMICCGSCKGISASLAVQSFSCWAVFICSKATTESNNPSSEPLKGFRSLSHLELVHNGQVARPSQGHTLHHSPQQVSNLEWPVNQTSESPDRYMGRNLPTLGLLKENRKYCTLWSNNKHICHTTQF